MPETPKQRNIATLEELTISNIGEQGGDRDAGRKGNHHKGRSAGQDKEDEWGE